MRCAKTLTAEFAENVPGDINACVTNLPHEKGAELK